MNGASRDPASRVAMQRLPGHVPSQAELAGILKTVDQRNCLAILSAHQVANGVEPSGDHNQFANEQFVPVIVVTKDAQLTRALIGGKSHFHERASLPSKTPQSELSAYAERVKGA